ncbi:unnamed protein product [Pleuronectes platessa]|uniref:Uncharacterized protein n=1 Tax=Pleuronectes platessa TaxID=8262 RepID=A0A9N7VU76_PLEPL|nr:unnamed protein product [Pleuronectes platessa]
MVDGQTRTLQESQHRLEWSRRACQSPPPPPPPSPQFTQFITVQQELQEIKHGEALEKLLGEPAASGHIWFFSSRAPCFGYGANKLPCNKHNTATVGTQTVKTIQLGEEGKGFMSPESSEPPPSPRLLQSSSQDTTLLLLLLLLHTHRLSTESKSWV